jgi:serine/threonine protein phosphatase PrpC
VTRVWLPHEDTPGLAMARAFGDLCLKDYGVISAPDVTHRRLTEQDKFVVLASDGVRALHDSTLLGYLSFGNLKGLCWRQVS